MGGIAILHPQDCLNDNIFPTPLKSRRPPKSNPNLTRSDGRKRSPPAAVRKNKPTATMVTDPLPAVKNLVMGQVKILKRGEPLDESLTVLKEINDPKSTVLEPVKPVQVPVKPVAGERKVLPAKKKAEKVKRRVTKTTPKIENLKVDDFALSSTDRLGPDPEMVPKQMNKNMADFFFAGSAFVDSPPPSSLPLPGFFTKGFVADVKDDPSSDLRRLLGLNLS